MEHLSNYFMNSLMFLKFQSRLKKYKFKAHSWSLYFVSYALFCALLFSRVPYICWNMVFELKSLSFANSIYFVLHTNWVKVLYFQSRIKYKVVSMLKFTLFGYFWHFHCLIIYPWQKNRALSINLYEVQSTFCLRMKEILLQTPYFKRYRALSKSIK